MNKNIMHASFIFICILCINFTHAESKKTTITQSLSFKPTSLDPLYATKSPDFQFITNLFEGLVAFDKLSNIVPGQAEDWTISDEGLIYTFRLKKDIYWSDGEPVVAKDFYTAIMRHLDPALNKYSKSLQILTPLKNASEVIYHKLPSSQLGLRVIDDKTIEFTLEKPVNFFLESLTTPTYLPVPSHLIEKLGENWAIENKPLVSNGPYVYKEHINKNIISCVKNQTYYDHENVYYDNFITKIISKKDQALYEFRNKDIDIIRTYRGKLINWANESLDAQIVYIKALGTTYLAINNKNKKFKDKRVRRALSLGISRNDLANRIPSVNIFPAYSFAADSNPADWTRLEPEWSKWSKEKRITEAKRLMKLAGYSESNPLKIDISVNASSLNELFVNAVKSMWSGIYVDSNVVSKPGKKHYNDLSKGVFEVARAKWIADFDDPSNFLVLLHSGGPKNYSNWSNKEYDKLLNLLSNTPGIKTRKEIFKKLEELIIEEVPIITSFSERRKAIIQNDIKVHSDTMPTVPLIKHFYPVSKREPRE